ncbi:DUF317 domain-containing protein [Streptomyces bambusae]|uniref:DUF317 domain-containing protein n=1 Tax=Streptomyces bambusae TaxID=1550616 RepID=A0ABS6Z952_9ACTN|nr:DUF317 domain-containing protein [Streptomyces bambusae]MBW5484272.1 DUF317 domain-containing protein [Streptomyces bambusae]
MADTSDIDGDVWVSPRYLAGSAANADPVLKPLFDLGFDRHNHEDGNLYLASPDRKIRLGFLPEGEDDGIWRITAYQDPFAAPAWGVCFNDTAPTELVTAFTTALADPAPVARWDSFLSSLLRPHLQLTPAVPPPPPAPTPLDVHRRTGTRPRPALTTTSVPRWSTSTSTSTRPAAARR